MPLKLEHFEVYVNGTGDDPDCYQVVVTHQDQLNAERQMPLIGVSDVRARPLALTTAWVWAALRRTGDYTAGFQRFHDTDCASIQKPHRPTATPEADAVDPTQLVESTVLPSPSPNDGHPLSAG